MNIQVPSFTGIGKEFVEAGQELGYPEIDINAPHTEGVFKLYHTNDNGVRDSPYRAFIKPIRRRRSLTIRKYALVNKVNGVLTEHLISFGVSFASIFSNITDFVSRR